MNFNSIITLLSSLVGPDKIGGWVRAGIGMGFVALVAKYPIVSSVVDPATQTQIAAAAATIVVGLWSQLVKTDNAKLKAVEAMPDVAKIIPVVGASDGVAAALADPTRPKVTAR